LGRKLKALKADLRAWNEKVFGNIGTKKQLCLDDLRVLGGLEEERFTGGGDYGEATVINDLEMITLLEEVSWRQKSRALWLREGDKCTSFFI
jgi:hypothetical protein